MCLFSFLLFVVACRFRLFSFTLFALDHSHAGNINTRHDRVQNERTSKRRTNVNEYEADNFMFVQLLHGKWIGQWFTAPFANLIALVVNSSVCSESAT